MTRADASEVARLRAELERERQAHEVALKEHDEHRRGLLALLEDLEVNRGKIEQARRDWNAAFDAVLDPIFLHDKDFRIVRANRAYAARTGLPFQELLGRPYWEVFPKGTGPLAVCRRAVAHAGEEEESEEEVRLETGEVFLSRNFPVRDAKGAWLFGLHIMQEVTEKRRTEEALRDSEEKFHRITAAAQDAILMIDNDGHIAFWNAAAERIFGYTAQEAMGQELHQLLAPERYHTDHRKGFGHFRDTGEGPVIGKILELVARRKDGTEFPIELSVSALKLKDRWQAVGILRDVTKRMQAEEALRDSEKKYRTLFEESFDGLFVASPGGKILDANRKCVEIFGYATKQEMQHLDLTKDVYANPVDLQRILAMVDAQGSAEYDVEVIKKNGDKIVAHCSLTTVKDKEDAITSYRGIIRDVTEQRRAAEALAASERLRRLLLDTLTQKIFYKDRNSTYIACNAAYAGDLHIEAEAIVGKTDYDFFPADLADRYRADDRKIMDSGQIYDVEEPYLQIGKEVWIHTVKTPMHDAAGNVIGVLGIFWDVTEQRCAAAALRRSEAGLAEAQRIAHLGSWELDVVANKLTWSDEIYRIFEIGPKEFSASYEAFMAAIHPDDREAVDRAYTEHVTKRAPYDIVHRLLFKDGRIKYVHERGETTYDDGRPLRSLGTVQDVTEHRLAELAMQKSNRALRALSACNTALIHAVQEKQLLQDMCRVIVEEEGYRLAWIGYVEHDESKTVRPMAYAGIEEGYLDRMQLTWADTERGHGPTGRAIRTGDVQSVRNILTDPDYALWRDEAAKRGYASSISLPLKEKDGITFGILNIYAVEPDAFSADETKLLRELADDLAYGILSIRVRAERNRLQEEHVKSDVTLRSALTDTIRAIALTVEKRDPYTAGHQNKVAELCVAIGRELGMDEERLEGMRLAATIHDIGKIYIPAEILNRPGKLSNAEFEIIKSHPEVGYDIIKDVKFPWPVADIILQHHERMDGSGYPKGLKGEDIAFEARILAVADVVEAMTSHRPYRPGLGLDAALAEVERHRGMWFDTAVVDACIKVIKDKQFQFNAA